MLKQYGTSLEKLKNHFVFWEFDDDTDIIPVILQNMNAAFAVVTVSLPVSISLCLSVNYFVGHEKHISPGLGVLTNVIAFVLCFLLGGRTHLFKSFSGTF